MIVEWDKKSQGAQYAAIRHSLPSACKLPPKFFSESHISHSFYAWQDGLQFKTRDSFDFSLAVNGVEISENTSGADAYFNYEYSMGAPVRTYKHAVRPIESGDTAYLHSTLREKAFTLTRKKPYGRIIHNGRLRDYDTGQWYYRESVINVFYISEKFDENLFTNQSPNFVYEQIGHLF